LRDTRNDENHAIWRVDRDGKNLVNLTPDPCHSARITPNRPTCHT